MTDSVVRSVSAHLVLDVVADSTAIFQIAVADRDLVSTETLKITSNGNELQPTIIDVPGAGRAHRIHLEAGQVQVEYLATLTGSATTEPPTPADELMYVRPSRYSESDRLTAVAAAEFAGIDDPRQLLVAVSSWVGTRLSYVAGSSRPTDGAVATLLLREGVCRDYAHLVVGLLRARDIPTRLVAVYAPGLDPMDFHAVAEAAIDGHWYVVDATTLAPRSSMVRISTGRDAADTAFLSTYGGNVQLLEIEVSAVVNGDLPNDDITGLVALG